MDRERIAYLLIALIVAMLAGVVVWRVFYARDRVMSRQRKRERARRRSGVGSDGNG